jgi:DNA-directed RNA polymerase subunit RPC12/RpoP
MDNKVWQEFYCGECSGYFRVRLNMALTIGVEIVCPKCKHKHHRFIKDGVIYENGRGENGAKEEICPPLSAYSKEPLTAKMKSATGYGGRRDGVKIEKEEDLNTRNPIADAMIKERWFELYGGNIG